jgi:hypothetical protein
MVIYRPSKNQVDTMFNEQGFAREFDSEEDAQEAINDHDFIEHCEYEIIEVDI